MKLFLVFISVAIAMPTNPDVIVANDSNVINNTGDTVITRTSNHGGGLGGAVGSALNSVTGNNRFGNPAL
jgi:hypothetical protein